MTISRVASTFLFITMMMPTLVFAGNADCTAGDYSCAYPTKKEVNTNGAMQTIICMQGKSCNQSVNGAIVEGKCTAQNVCTATATKEGDTTKQLKDPAQVKDEATKASTDSGGSGSTGTQDPSGRGGTINGGSGTDPTGTAGAGGGTGTQSGQTPVGSTGGGCQYCNDAYAGGDKGEQLIQQQARDAQARGDSNVGFTNTNSNGGISGGTPVFRGNTDTINNLRQIQNLGSTNGISRLSGNSGCSVCDDASLRDWKTGTPVYITGDSGFISNAKAALSDLFGWNAGLGQAQGFGSSLFSSAPSWSAPSSNVSGFGSIGSNAVVISQPNTTAAPLAGNSSSVVFGGTPTGVPGIVTSGPPPGLTSAQQAAWNQSYNQAMSICGGSPSCGAFAQQKADAAVAQMGMNSGANSYLSSCGGFSSCVSQGIDNAKQQFSNALGGAKDALFGSGTDSGVPGIVVSTGDAQPLSGADGISVASSDGTLPLSTTRGIVSVYTPGGGGDNGGLFGNRGEYLPDNPDIASRLGNTYKQNEVLALQRLDENGNPIGLPRAVRIADSGYYPGRVLDLQTQTAKDMGFNFSQGTEKMEITSYGVASSPQSAQAMVNTLNASFQGYDLSLQPQPVATLEGLNTVPTNAPMADSIASTPLERISASNSSFPNVGESNFAPSFVAQTQGPPNSFVIPLAGQPNGVSAIDTVPAISPSAAPSVVSSSDVAPPSVSPVTYPDVASSGNAPSPVSSVTSELPIQVAVARPDGSATSVAVPESIGQLTGLPKATYASPFDLGRDTAVTGQDGQTYNFSQVASNVPLGRLNPALGSSENVFPPSGGYIPLTDAQWAKSVTASDYEDPGARPIDPMHPALTDGVAYGGDMSNPQNQQAMQQIRDDAVNREQRGVTVSSRDANVVNSRASARTDTVSTPRWVFFAPGNPLGSPSDTGSFLYANSASQSSGGYVSQAGSWAQIPSANPGASPFIAHEGNMEFTQAAPAPALGSPAYTQVPEGGSIPTSRVGQGGSELLNTAANTQAPSGGGIQNNRPLNTDANTAYTSTGPIDTKAPVVNEDIAQMELQQSLDERAIRDAQPQVSDVPTEPATPKTDSTVPNYAGKLGEYLSSLGEKLGITQNQDAVPGATGEAPAVQSTGPTTPFVGVNPDGSLTSLPSEKGASADLTLAKGMNDAVQQGSGAYYKVVPDGTLTQDMLPSGSSGSAGNGSANIGSTQSDTPGLKPVPDVTKTPGSEYVSNLQKSGMPVAQNVQDQKDAPPTTAGFGSDAKQPALAGPRAPGAGGRVSAGTAGTGDTGGTGAANGKGPSDAMGLLNSALGLLKGLGGKGSGRGSSSAAQPTTPVLANSASVLQTPVPATQFTPAAPLTAAPQVSVVANPDSVASGKTSIISWTAQWAAPQAASTTRECALGDATGAVLVAHGDVTGSYETAALTRPTYFLVGCKQTGGKLGSTVVLVKVNGSTQSAVPLPGASVAYQSSSGASTAGSDLSAALYGASPATGSVPASNTQQQQQPVNVACDPNSSSYFDCLSGKMQFVDKLY